MEAKQKDEVKNAISKWKERPWCLCPFCKKLMGMSLEDTRKKTYMNIYKCSYCLINIAKLGKQMINDYEVNEEIVSVWMSKSNEHLVNNSRLDFLRKSSVVQFTNGAFFYYSNRDGDGVPTYVDVKILDGTLDNCDVYGLKIKNGKETTNENRTTK